MLQQIFNRQHQSQLLLFSIIIGIILFSCNKIDTSFTKKDEVSFEEKFFSIKEPLNPIVKDVIEKLKAENIRTNFLNKLPLDCGIPVWDKLLFQTEQSNNTLASGDSSEIIIIPLTINNDNLSSLLFAKEELNGTYTIGCYTINDLYEKTHGANVDTLEATDALTVFFYMENRTYNTTKFYHIPANLFSNVTELDPEGMKTIEILDDSVLTTSFAPIVWVCVEYLHICPICNHYPCIEGYSYMYTVCTANGGGISGGGGSGGGGIGGGSSGGGGVGLGSGSGSGSGNGNPCNPFAGGGSWYNLLREPNPCNLPPPPPPPPQDTILNPCNHASTLGNNAEFKGMLQNLKNHSNNPNDTTEYGKVFTTTANGGLSIDSVKGTLGKKGIDSIPIPNPISGIAHNHFANSLSIFSPDDLWAICSLFNSKKMADSSKFTLPLITAEGTQYMLMIENVTKFRNWAQKFTEGDLNLYKRFYGLINKILETNTVAENEKRFLQYLKLTNGGSGLILFSGNVTFTEWTRKLLDSNNNVIIVPCVE